MKHCDFILRNSIDYINCILHEWTKNNNNGFEWIIEKEKN